MSFAQNALAAYKAYVADAKTTPARLPGRTKAFFRDWYRVALKQWSSERTTPAASPDPEA